MLKSSVHLVPVAGFEIGCVSSDRYYRTCRMQTHIAEGIQFLKSIVKPLPHWRKLLQMPSSKGTLLKRWAYPSCVTARSDSTQELGIQGLFKKYREFLNNNFADYVH